jgi:hypothetical protein
LPWHNQISLATVFESNSSMPFLNSNLIIFLLRFVWSTGWFPFWIVCDITQIKSPHFDLREVSQVATLPVSAPAQVLHSGSRFVHRELLIGDGWDGRDSGGPNTDPMLLMGSIGRSFAFPCRVALFEGRNGQRQYFLNYVRIFDINWQKVLSQSQLMNPKSGKIPQVTPAKFPLKTWPEWLDQLLYRLETWGIFPRVCRYGIIWSKESQKFRTIKRKFRRNFPGFWIYLTIRGVLSEFLWALFCEDVIHPIALLIVSYPPRNPALWHVFWRLWWNAWFTSQTQWEMWVVKSSHLQIQG